MVTNNMFRTYEGKKIILEAKYPTTLDLTQMPYTDQITEIAPLLCALIPELPSNISSMH